MRGGLFRPVAPEVVGGGYTFEHKIFERLLECAPTSKYEFVVLEDLDGGKATGKTPNLTGDAAQASVFSKAMVCETANYDFETVIPASYKIMAPDVGTVRVC